jgi:hypothetical protein
MTGEPMKLGTFYYFKMYSDSYFSYPGSTVTDFNKKHNNKLKINQVIGKSAGIYSLIRRLMTIDVFIRLAQAGIATKK